MSGRRPNILIAMADDYSWPHSSAYGCRFVNTPSFDRVAAEGVLFENAFCPAPSCSPSRASFLTGRQPWQLEEAMVLWGPLNPKFTVYPDLLAAAGYHVGLTNKGWGPCLPELDRAPNYAGPAYDSRTLDPPAEHIRPNDYAANFVDFLAARPEGAPFCFWYGAKEPHRPYEDGCGVRLGKNLDDVEVPPYLPDCREVRSDLADYAVQVEWFDRHLGRMVDQLERIGELDNTIVIVTGDNGMPFPRAKVNLYEQGLHVPFAVRWGNRVPAGRRVTDLTTFVDVAPTLLEAAGLPVPDEMTGRSLLDVLCAGRSGRVDPTRNMVLTSRERHATFRPGAVGYPSRCLRTDDYLYVRNLHPERSLRYECDPSPSLTYLKAHREREDVRVFHDLSFGPRPEEELYAVEEGAACMTNLATTPKGTAIVRDYRSRMEQCLREQGDPRFCGRSHIVDRLPDYRNPDPATLASPYVDWHAPA